MKEDIKNIVSFIIKEHQAHNRSVEYSSLLNINLTDQLTDLFTKKLEEEKAPLIKELTELKTWKFHYDQSIKKTLENTEEWKDKLPQPPKEKK